MNVIKLVSLLILLTIVVDFVETAYYLNEKGFAYELNPDIIDNDSLNKVFLIRYCVTLVGLVALYELFKRSSKVRKFKKSYELFLMFLFGFNTAIILKGLVIILQSV